MCTWPPKYSSFASFWGTFYRRQLSEDILKLIMPAIQLTIELTPCRAAIDGVVVPTVEEQGDGPSDFAVEAFFHEIGEQ